jgi:hypothetical protein
VHSDAPDPDPARVASVSVYPSEVRAVLRSWLPAVLLGVALAGAASPAHAAPGQRVCDPATLAGGEACFYSGPEFTGTEFDLSIPLGVQLPVPGDGACTDLPTGIGLAGSVVNASGATLYVLPSSCPDTHAGGAAAVIVTPHYSGNITVWTDIAGTHSVRMCGAGLVLDPLTLGCAYPR